MKNINLLLSFLWVVLVLGCNKKKEEDSVPETQQGVKFYSGLPNSNYGPISKFYDNTTKSNVWLFGSFNSLGLQKDIRRIVLNKNSDSYFSNYLIDQNGKPYMVYTTDKNGLKDNVILKIDYPVNADKIIYNLYKYNWTTKQDSLLMQQEFNITAGTSVFNYRYITNTNYDYWDRTVSEFNNITNNFNSAINGKIIIDSYPNAKISTTHISESLASYSLVSIILGRKIDEAKKLKGLSELNKPVELNDFLEASDQVFTNLINATNTEIPNPIGSPSIPTISLIYGKWKVVKRVSQNGTTTYPNCIAGADACYLYLQSSGLHSQSYDGINFGVQTTFSISGQIVNMTGNSATINYVSKTELVWTSDSANIKVYFIRI